MFQNTWKIAHLDIKPLNFLIREKSDTSYDVVLTDFGISQCYQTCLLASKSATNPEITSLEDLINAVSSNELNLTPGKGFKIRQRIWLIWVGWLANKKTFQMTKIISLHWLGLLVLLLLNNFLNLIKSIQVRICILLVVFWFSWHLSGNRLLLYFTIQ